MTAILHLFVLVPLAYVAALISAAAIVTVGLFDGRIDADTAPIALGAGIGVTLFGGMASFIPSLFAIAVAEAFRWRTVAYYLIAGGTVGYVCNEITSAWDGLEFADNLLALCIAAGAAGGFVYWLIAGVNAGGWQVAADPKRPTSTG